MKKILVISHDKVGQRMAGPGMRYHQIALELSKRFEVTLATFNPAYLDNIGKVPYKYTDIKVYDFRKAFDKYDVIIALWLSEEMIQYAKSKGKQLVFDLYAPVPVENLVNAVFAKRELKPEDDYNYAVSIESYRRFFMAGDFFMCSNDVQKDFWTGYAFAAGAVVPSGYNAFPIYDRIGLCAMGINLDEMKTAGKKDLLRERVPQIKKDDFVLVWTGGIWDWFDALTPIKAIQKLKERGINNVRLVFLATRHPNTDVPEMGETEKAYELATKLGLKDTSVFFLEGWLEYDKRLDYFLAGNAALYAHKPSIEARFSHRTRVLDHILTLLPTVATSGDYFADLVAEHNLGYIVEPEDPKAMADAIEALMDKKTAQAIRKNIEKIRPEFTWEHTLEPLVAFLEANYPARPLTHATMPQKAGTLLAKPGIRQIKRFVPRTVKETIKRRIVKHRS